MPRSNKYLPLTNYLHERTVENSIRMSFAELGEIINIPPCALRDRTAWANCTTNHASQFQRSWQNTGYRIETIDLEAAYVVFSHSGFEQHRTPVRIAQPERRAVPSSYEEELLLTVPNNLTELEHDRFLMVALTQNNSSIVEECIRNDPAYQSRGKAIMEAKFNANDYSESAYFEIIRCIAAENSTRTATEAMQCMAQFCAAPDKHFLQRVETGDSALVDDILRYLVEHECRKDKSLASKVCRYLNEWCFNGCAYTINDSVVRAILPYYLAYYDVDRTLWKNKNFDDLSYVEFYALFSRVRDHADRLDNHKLDHLIWYAYKNDGIRSEVAKALATIL